MAEKLPETELVFKVGDRVRFGIVDCSKISSTFRCHGLIVKLAIDDNLLVPTFIQSLLLREAHPNLGKRAIIACHMPILVSDMTWRVCVLSVDHLGKSQITTTYAGMEVRRPVEARCLFVKEDSKSHFYC